ncbi:MAG: UvrD-helicase domain-containing protein, partial [Candidatus Korobacteraceae bacterium]
MPPSSAAPIMEPEPADAAVRRAVIDHRRSFIVQAPAGSGKTELLIQRFLNLLAHADIAEPEAILSITFTRKAANEMRNRILTALEQAAPTPVTAKTALVISAPELDPNSQLTASLAAAALERDRQRGWGILESPARLQVRTVDSFCESVVREMPLLARFLPGASISEEVEPLYRQAAEQTLRMLADSRPEIASAFETLLLHLDNNLKRAQALLVDMLKRRDQWMPLIGRGGTVNKSAEFRQRLESGLARAVCSELAEIRSTVVASFSPAQKAEFLRLARYAASNLRGSACDSRVASLASIQDFPSDEPEQIAMWLGIKEFFLTRSNGFRARLTVNEGFPPGPEAMPWKQAWQELLASVRAGAQAEALLAALSRVECLPPVVYTDQQWECVCALFVALPLAVAQLKVIFAEQGACDFIEIAQAAQQALNPAEPSPVALSLGCRIQHILMDEFQDTSVAQVELLSRLTSTPADAESAPAGDPGAEWARPTQAGRESATADGNTLFLVGDPMQSIYGFRKAEVTLFEDARQGRASLPPLAARELVVNFRSSAALVGWYNRVFKRLLRESNQVTGAVNYTPAQAAPAPLDSAGAAVATKLPHPSKRGLSGPPAGTASSTASELDGVHLHGVEAGDRAAEAACVAGIAERVLRYRPAERIAILVRARTHLPEVVRALQASRIPFRAVDIEPLGERQIVRDLHSLALAITHPANRIAWLALLRSPVCGLTLADLLELCREDERTPIPELLQLRRERLTTEARQRCDRLLAVLAEAMSWRGRSGLRQIVERAWLAFGGLAASADQERDLREAAAFLDLLQQCERGDELADPVEFQRKLEELYAPPTPAQTQTAGTVEVMTIHTAKGLQWDTVIVPGLARPPHRGEEQLLYWREFVSAGETHLLLAPIEAAWTRNDDNSLKKYLRRLASDRAREELKRLLYVACTRARTGLHLVTELPEEGQAPNADSMLSLLWGLDKIRAEMKPLPGPANAGVP